MMVRLSHHPAAIAALLFCLLLVPPLKHTLEATMTAQMLVQIPLLVCVGLLSSHALPACVLAVTGAWNHRGITGLVLVTLAAAFWMLPRSLDAAVTNPTIDAAKYLSIPLMIGLPFAMSWQRMSFIVRGVILAEFIATFFRLGWLYLISPIRLCNNYLLGDQQRLGWYMLLVGAALLLWIAWKLVWGRFESIPDACPNSASGDRDVMLRHS